MRFPPPEVIVTWPKPNYKNPETRGPTLMIVELIILPLALIALGLRLYVRLCVVRRSWWDDWLMVAAAFFCCGVTIAVILATQLYGWNIHVWDLTYTQMVQGRQVSIAGQTIFVFASGFSKLSILVSYLRISVKGTWFHRLTWASIALVAAAIPGFLLILWLQCRPPSSYWNLLTLSRDCVPEAPPLMAQTIVTVITDFIVYVLPIHTLWTLKLPIGERLSLITLFGFGGIVVAAGCMRTYWIHYVELETYDVTWEGFSLWAWAAVEVNLGVICGCAPVLKPLFFRSSHSVSSRYYNNSTSLNTLGSAGQWSRKRKALRSVITTANDKEFYIQLDSIASGRRGSDSATAGLSPRTQEPSDKDDRSTRSGYPESPQQAPTIPEPAFMAQNGNYSNFSEERKENNRKARFSRPESWIDDSSI